MWSNSEIQRTFVGHDLYRLGGSYRSRFCIWPKRKATRSFNDRVASNLAARKVRSRLAATASLSDHRSRTDPIGWRSLLAAAGRFVAEVCIVCAPKPFGFGGSSLREAAGSACIGEADFFPEKKMTKIHINTWICTNALMISSWLKSFRQSLKVPSMYQALALHNTSSCCWLAKRRWRRPRT